MGNITSESKVTVINCPVHETPFNGICGDKQCLQSGLICQKCTPEACTYSQSHELISIDEFYLRFFARSSGSIDFKKLHSLIEDLKTIDREVLSNQVEQYSSYASSLIDEKLKNFNERIENRLELMRKNIQKKLETIQREFLEAEARIDLASFEIPENFSLEETTKFFEKNKSSVRDMENMINLVKKYSDNEKLQMNQKDMETIIYTKNLIDQSVKENLEEKLKIAINELQTGLDELLLLISYSKENTSIFFSGVKKFSSNPNQLVFKQDISNQGQKSYTIDSVITAFTTVEGMACVAWANPSHNIDIYELKSNKIIKSLTGHTQHIFIVRHFYHAKATTDYLISTSYERNIKIWNANTLSLVMTVSNCHTGCYLYSAMILIDDFTIEGISKAYAVSTAPNEYTKVWDIPTGNFIKNIGTTTDYTYFISTWYDHKNKEVYIINANSVDVKLYEYKTGNVYKTFKSESSTWHMSAMVHEVNTVPHLFETDGNGYLRVWNIQTGTIFKTIHAPSVNLRGICLWNDQYVISASSDKSFKVFDINTWELSVSVPGHENVLCTVEKIVHPNFGECLVTSAIDGKIKLWVGPSFK
jgi:WD40 repeat protein